MESIQLNLSALGIAFGALQGYFLAAILFWHRKGNRVANRCLAALVLVISLQLTDTCFSLSGALVRWPHLIYLTRPLWFLIAPLLYFYIKLMVQTPVKFSSRDLLHLTPMLLSIISISDFYFLSANAKLSQYTSLYKLSEPSALMLFYWNLYTAQVLIYVGLSIRRLYRYEKQVKPQSANSNPIQLNWLKRLLNVFAIYLVFSMITILFLTVKRTYISFFDYTSICILAIFVHSIAIIAIRQPEKLFPVLERLKEKYRHSALSDSIRKEYTGRLNSVMENERPYLNSELKLGDLAATLNMLPHHLSQIINQELKSNFYDFVNEYRVKEAQKRLTDPASQSFTIEGIALDVGFKSRASFYRVFKKMTGKTPTQYIESMKVLQLT